MKKILILNPYLSTLGGGEKYMAYLCRFFEEYYSDDASIEILVYTNSIADVFDENYTSVRDVERQFDMTLSHTSIRKLDTVLGENAGMLKKWLFWRKVERAAIGYDLFISLMDLSRYRGLARKNVYICMFPPLPLCFPGRFSVKNLAARLRNYRFHSSYDIFLPISQFSNRWLEGYWKKSKKYKIIYPPVFELAKISGRYEEAKKENIILSVGRFFVGAHSKKQLDTLMFFMEYEDELGDYEYHLVGAVAETKHDVEYLSKIKRLAKRSKRVFIHDNCPYEELVDLYAKTKIFWHATGYGVEEETEPYKMEHFGITTVEAMSFGAVPVVINKGGQPEIVDDGTNGFLWDTEDECIEKTRLLADDAALRKKLALSAVERSKDFTVEAFFRANAEVFDNLF